ncbi:DUF4304 domain-containing protein [Nocardioides sp. GXZ039]|uniref:DUF4304 domain-containing protein n=1 Tax=Nocardioides sp. GXZ039 TaxID=3136018 RepID=UPI0030F3968E
MHPEDRDLFDRFRAWKSRPKDFSPATESDPTPQVVYSDLMKGVFAPALREAGLKGSGGRFELPSEKCWAQLGFQKSVHSDSSILRFTVNLSVIDRETWARRPAVTSRPGTKPSPSIYYGAGAGQEQARIGALMPAGEDFWWSLSRGHDPTSVAEEVVSALIELAVPWLVARTAAKP